jgi:hypothetical protein
MHDALLIEANRTSSGDRITDDDLNLAYNRLNYPDKRSLEFADAQAVISQALRENKAFEWVSYGMAVVLFGFGLGLFVFGVARGDAGTRPCAAARSSRC